MNQKERFLLKSKRFEIGSHTWKSYNNSLTKFYDKFDLYDEDFKKINSDDIEDWIDGMDYKLSTINVIIEHSKEFCAYLKKKNLINYNYFDAISKFGYKDIMQDSKKKYIPSKEEVKMLILRSGIREKENVNTFDFYGSRDQCILQLLASQGLRKNIIREMRMSDIKKNDDYVVIEIDSSRTKAKISHRIVFGGKTMKLFNRYLKARENHGIDSEHVFTSIRGNELNPSDITDLFNKAVRKANIKVEEGVQLSPHNLRHFTASMLVNNNENDILIKGIMNWNIDHNDMRQRYSNHAEMYDEEKVRATSFLD